MNKHINGLSTLVFKSCSFLADDFVNGVDHLTIQRTHFLLCELIICDVFPHSGLEMILTGPANSRVWLIHRLVVETDPLGLYRRFRSLNLGLPS